MDDGWKLVEVESEIIAVNGNVHSDAIDIGPTVELVLGNGHDASGNGHQDEAPEPPSAQPEGAASVGLQARPHLEDGSDCNQCWR